MRKRQLTRRLRECREALDGAVAELDLAAELDRSGGWRERAATEQTARIAAEAARDEYSRALANAGHRGDRLERELREAKRHLEHHHRNGSFTLIRECTGQVAAENERLRREVGKANRQADGLAHERSEARHALAWHVDEGGKPR